MKLKKLISFAAAATVAASVAATTASADWAPVPDAVGGLSSSNQLYMIPLFCNVETPDIPLTDRGIDLAKLGYVSFTFQIDEADREFFDGMFGGGLGISLHAKNIVKPEEVTAEDKVKEKPDGTPTTMWGYYNWDNSRNYWGVIDNEAPDPNSYDIDGEYIEGMPKYINCMDKETNPAWLEPMGDYTYRIKTDLVNPVVEGDCTVEDITDVRVFLQSWQSSMFKAEVTRCVIFDTDNKAIMAFDSKGNEVETTADDEKEPVMPEPYVEGEEGDTSAATSDTASTATSDNASAATSDAASSATSAATSNAASSAPAASAAASTTSNASDNGGLPVGAIVGICAGVVVVIVIIIVVVKKKKG